MKKLSIMLLCLFCLAGCNAGKEIKNETMYIKPSEFSEETKEVLKLFDEEIQFFDISLDDNAKSHTVSIWVYSEGEWKESGKSYGETEFLGNRYAIRLTETSCELYSIDDNGHTKVKYPQLNTAFDETLAKISWKLDYEKEIKLNEEIPLWVMIGSEESYFQYSHLKNDFRSIDCSTGIAVTLTISDEIVE